MVVLSSFSPVMQASRLTLARWSSTATWPGVMPSALRDVLARDLVEHAQRDHRALDVRQRLHAAVQADPILGGGDELVGAGRRRRAARPAARDRRREAWRGRAAGGGCAPRFGVSVISSRRDSSPASIERVRRGQGDERLERVLDGVERVLGGQPLRARHRRPAPAGADGPAGRPSRETPRCPRRRSRSPNACARAGGTGERGGRPSGFGRHGLRLADR